MAKPRYSNVHRCRWGLLLALLCPALAFVGIRPSRLASRVAAAAESRTVAEDKEVSDKLDQVLRKRGLKKEGAEEEEEEENADQPLSESAQKAVDAVDKVTGKKLKRRELKAPKKKSRSIVKQSLDEVLKSASDEDERPNFLPAKRDVYKEVGITRQEVDRYWKRRDESSKNFVDKFVGPYFLIIPVLLVIILYLVYDSIVNPQENVTASMTGLD
mmetsp:Transcript_22557/g.52225  ORF Transcript_22557/g.52225 Transcript_22557/m.52225 type:complete len:215 (+) Transcript_22557:44-688(+)